MNLVDHLDKLHAFQVIIQAGTLQKAARELHLTQPSLTRLIQTLEKASGVRLVSTGRSGVSPTPAGKLLMQYSHDALRELEKLELRLKHPDDPLSGQLSIGSYESLAEYLWPDFLNHFRETTPHLKLSIQTRQTRQHIKALENSDIDILVDAEPRLVGDFTSWKLYEDRFNCFVSPTFKNKFDEKTITEVPLIYSPAAFDRNNTSILQHMEEMGLHFTQKIELDSFTSVRTFCQKGLGIGVMPLRLATEALRSRSLAPVNLGGFPKKGFGPHDLYATVRSDRSEDSRIKHVLKTLRAWLKN